MSVPDALEAPGERGERGAGSVLVLSMVAVLAVATGAVLVLVSAVAVRHRAAAAADLAALAAAQSVLSGPAQACGLAARVAGELGGTLVTCELHGRIAEVAVSVPHRGVAGFLPDPVRLARAGPGAEP